MRIRIRRTGAPERRVRVGLPPERYTLTPQPGFLDPTTSALGWKQASSFAAAWQNMCHVSLPPSGAGCCPTQKRVWPTLSTAPSVSHTGRDSTHTPARHVGRRGL